MLAARLALPPDGRQSAVALGVRRGVRRLLRDLGHVSLPEVTLANGRRADVMALGEHGLVTIIEIKSCLADYRADRKWPDYRDYCDQLYFAIPETMSAEVMPECCGLLVADSFGAAILREAPCHPLSGARRKTVMLRFARAAATLLHALDDPGAVPQGAL